MLFIIIIFLPRVSASDGMGINLSAHRTKANSARDVIEGVFGIAPSTTLFVSEATGINIAGPWINAVKDERLVTFKTEEKSN